VLRFYLFTLRSWRLGGSTVLSLSGGSLSCCRHILALTSPRQQSPVFSPFLRQLGGSACVSRRSAPQIFVNSVAFPVLPAGHRGGNDAKIRSFRPATSYS